MAWKIYFFETARGEKIVKEFIKNLSGKTMGKVSHNLDLLKIHGPFLGMPYSRRLAKGINELRIRGRQEVRILYTFSKNNIYLLHAFKKKTQKTPKKEIEIAEERKKTLDVT
ncbi:type II toxin-antitoxin system RelE/ParE family toxin [Candidatus Woesebacteria bacterium]|nr:type II toxin-antitoxin system RelE/ParE family toxin [Candidatus Woesebacteria bacterium]